MKDGYAREQIEGMKARLVRLESANLIYQTFVIQYCPNCKHDTVQTPIFEPYYGYNPSWTTGSTIVSPYHRCTTCGAKITCETKCVCKVIEEVK